MSEEVAFLGKLTASMTHEIRNVLTIIKESSGLLQDILAADRDGSVPSRDKLQKTLGKIQDQVDRGAELLASHSRLAHSMDDRKATCEVGDVLTLVLHLMQRFAHTRNVRLEISACDPALEVRTHLFDLLMVLSKSIDYCLDQSVAGAKVTLEGREAPGGITIRIATDQSKRPVASSNGEAAELDSLRPALCRLNADLHVVGEGRWVGLDLDLPSKAR